MEWIHGTSLDDSELLQQLVLQVFLDLSIFVACSELILLKHILLQQDATHLSIITCPGAI